MGVDHVVLILIMVGLTLYAVLGGADFGAGVWEFNTALQAMDRERSLIYRAVVPVWEANHVWLIFVVVGLYTGFPRAFATASQALWVPLSLAAGGIVFRGSALCSVRMRPERCDNRIIGEPCSHWPRPRLRSSSARRSARSRRADLP